ncbi:hypothetical protein MNBD_BACTEROID06-781 [hydrothermal vent metagenome]|uniref:Outer membrane protein beta-barrel domain-containing protein n=1 Tax=hydrothermal vent metagenome TaxID=652676 RepID=A0A3B0V6E0_9ZZZZ
MKLTLILLLNLLFVFNSLAQITQIDFMVGPNLSSARGSNSTEELWSPDISISGGVGITYSVATKSAIIVKLLFENRAFTNTDKINYTDENNLPVEANGEVNLNVAYINIPFLYSYQFGNKVKFNIETGPYVGIYLYDKLKVEVEGLPNVDAAQLNSNASDFGVSLGFNAYYPVSDKMSLKFGVQNYLGFNDISGDFSSFGDFKTNTLALQLGISLGINSKI